MFDSLNKFRKTVMDGVDTSEMEFKPLKDFCGKVVNVNGFFFTDGKLAIRDIHMIDTKNGITVAYKFADI